jgi:heat shock protein HtpX
MSKSFFDEQRTQRHRTANWLAVEVVLLIAVGYLVSLPWQFWQSCSVPDTDTCVPLGFELGLTFKIAVAVLVYLGIAVLVARRQAYPKHGRAPSDDYQERRLPGIVEQMAIAAGVPAPRVTVLDDSSMNAYATTDTGNGVIVVTSGLLSALDDRAVTGVIAHEMAHLKNKDVQVKWVATFGVGLVILLAATATFMAIAGMQAAEQQANDDENNNSSAGGGLALAAGAFALVLWLLALPAAVVVRAAISRRREQLADASAVQFTRDPTGLRVALEMMAGRSAAPQHVGLATATLWINNPLVATRWPKFVQKAIDTHPPIEQRIAWLRSLEGANALWQDFG